jgi:GAF domain-containing protein
MNAGDDKPSYQLTDEIARALEVGDAQDYPLVDALIGRSPGHEALMAAHQATMIEADRQSAVDRVEVSRLRSDPELVRIAREAALHYGMPIAAISLLSRDRQLLVARCGTELWETARADSFCTVAIQRPGEPLLVADACADPRFAERASVTGPPFIRFYAGMPIVDRGGYALGALCIADTEPHHERADLSSLMMMAHEVERRLGH